MKRAKGIRLWITAALMAAALPAASKGPGITAAPILQIPVGARAIGMGAAFTGVADDVSTIYYNPAGLSNLRYRELSFMYLKGLDEQKTEYIAAATPLPIAGIIGGGYTAVGASVLFAQHGTIEVNRTREDGSFLSSDSINAGGDLVATVSYAERVAHFDLRMRHGTYDIHHFLGVNGKIIRSTLAEAYSATAVAADLGYFVKVPDLGFTAGVSALNVGSRMRFIEESDPLPLTLRTGFAYTPLLPESMVMPAQQALTFAADAEILTVEDEWHVNTGVEYTAWRHYALRLGYRIHRDIAGFTMGLGAAWRGFRLDYAWAMTDDLNDVHRFSVTYRFGRMSERKRESRRRPFIESMPEREELEDIEERKPETLDLPRRPRRTIPDRGRVAPGWIY